MNADFNREKWGEVWQELLEQCIDARLAWATWSTLYLQHHSHAALMNQTAPRAFHYLDQVLFHNQIITIGRLLDHASYKKGKQEFSNASVNYLLEITPTLSEHRERQIRRARCLLQSVASPVLECRNKHIAHADLEHKLTQQWPIGIKPRKINRITQLVYALLAMLKQEVQNTGLGPFDGENQLQGEIRYLLRCIKLGIEPYREMRMTRPQDIRTLLP